jgi:hypothetical protein
MSAAMKKAIIDFLTNRFGFDLLLYILFGYRYFVLRVLLKYI